ncbi:hypothetical protein DPMN_144585 [Dreissena polymorpha]|uniref:Uncharacterized protein n=1 Tax=Dreissena polymorpha TaxID=45954 RepID=A0A9D4GIJ5_DREPO|nr:hypothetical protein DPMN_144585 [Dreissena polymorpha]
MEGADRKRQTNIRVITKSDSISVSNGEVNSIQENMQKIMTRLDTLKRQSNSSNRFESTQSTGRFVTRRHTAAATTVSQNITTFGIAPNSNKLNRCRKTSKPLA